MRTSIWDILTGITLLGILCLVLVFGAIALNPQSVLNPFKPYRPTLVPVISFPTPTEAANRLPPTWTPEVPPVEVDQPVPTQADTVEPQVNLRPSSTPIPTNTVLVLPTFTATVHSGGSGVGGGNCSVVFQEPVDDSFVTAGKEFSVRWTIRNNSSKMWRRDSVDIRWMGGEKMHPGNNLLDMPYDVGNNGMVDITMNMTAPSAGSFTTNWALTEGNISVCRFYLTIRAMP